ncbi:hypothetical protein SERLA73DRAFT_142054 [Serpula lacrymans var. lacrymans S7.3]|uniref:Uncharacterized protein n=1 Tax=Serpula lacrymans var. lacrymans (strain S7.3) TaxID=936435 RepID=F8Q765_SERL3|nr:hypothetical protein SERLA73DRAFT_142054 [Serpula lacrymans var. lacrymans S7.3]
MTPQASRFSKKPKPIGRSVVRQLMLMAISNTTPASLCQPHERSMANKKELRADKAEIKKIKAT